MTQIKMNNVKAEILLEGVFLSLKNAENLCKEAELLHQHDMYARSYALSHFAREEVGKSLMLARAYIERLAGIKIDWKLLNRRFRNHKNKLGGDAAFSVAILGKGMLEEGFNPEIAFKVIEGANNRKNSCLYTDWKDGKFVDPSKVINGHQSDRNLSMAKFRVELAIAVCEELPKLQDTSKEQLLSNYTDPSDIKGIEDIIGLFDI
ncbi:AbiV family abortive infection protein [Aliivibrio sp. S2TY2]|uniref:AbiV family abortive infection protein n=1 Tax=Aliivibrio TaxID=511678 RepID=UPI001112CDCE|nr:MULTISPECIES: AbiV family abortive infection protein [Aliivibrio]MDD9177082.1 AbiV family abortive infection protein [Aliivibrio sp. S3TY1]MDD9194155.1 AbiV family abortive infection protein [Aliivibrio sp. S2TY2]